MTDRHGQGHDPAGDCRPPQDIRRARISDALDDGADLGTVAPTARKGHDGAEHRRHAAMLAAVNLPSRP